MTGRTSFSATDAALTGFEIARREPLTVLVWAAVQALVVTPLTWASSAAVAPYRAQLRAASGGDPAAVGAALLRLAPLQLGVSLGLLALLSVLFCGVYRTVLRPSAGGPGRLRVGADEARVVASVLLLLLLTLGLVLAAAVAGGIVAGVLTAAAPRLTALWTVLSFLLALAGLVTAAVRLSLSPVMSFATGRVTVFGSWRLTRGRFWALFGAYLVAGLLALITEVVVLLVIAAAALPVVGVRGLAALFDPQAAAAPLSLSIAFTALGGLLSGFLVALQAGAPASAYAQLAEGTTPFARHDAPPPPSADGLPRFGR